MNNHTQNTHTQTHHTYTHKQTQTHTHTDTHTHKHTHTHTHTHMYIYIGHIYQLISLLIQKTCPETPDRTGKEDMSGEKRTFGRP